LTGCGGHINGAGTVNGNCGAHPTAFELGDSMGELMSVFLGRFYRSKEAIPIKNTFVP
jgi:hypothetical protein